MKFRRTFWRLRSYGFSAFKALEILIDAQRGKWYARHWVGMAFQARRPLDI